MCEELEDKLLEYHNSHFDCTLSYDDYWEMEHSEVPRELYDVCVDGICDPLINEFGNHNLYFYYEYDREFRVELFVDEEYYDEFKSDWEERYDEKCNPKNMMKRMGETLEQEYPYIHFKFKKVEPYYDYVQFAFVGHCREQIYIYTKNGNWFVLDGIKEKAFFTDEKELKKYIKKHYPKHYKNYKLI